MPILNYTTKIQAEQTAGEIQKILSGAGAKAITCEYNDDQIMCAISFSIMTEHGLITFRLPAQMDGVYQALQKTKAAPAMKSHEQAARVAWRILKDWVEAQVAIIEAGMAEPAEAFLPYAVDEQGFTVYAKIKSGGMSFTTNKHLKNDH